jgi:hypothetical protein
MRINAVRSRVLEELELLSLPSLQLEYQSSLINHAGHAPAELVCGFCNDIYHPKSPEFIDAFSENEHKALAHLYGLMVEVAPQSHSTVEEMLKDTTWRKVVTLAKDLHAQFKNHV